MPGHEAAVSAAEQAPVADERAAAAAVAPAALEAIAGRPLPARLDRALLRAVAAHAGNRAAARTLARKEAPPKDVPIRGIGRGQVADESEAPIYGSPDADGAPVGTLQAGRTVRLIATAGLFYAVDVDGKKVYVRQTDMASAVDVPSQQSQAEWEKRADEAGKRLDETGHKLGSALRGTGTAPTDSRGTSAFPDWFRKLQWRLSMTTTWSEAEEEAQHLLRDYAKWYMDMWHEGPLPPNLREMFEYIGRSSINSESAGLGKFKAVSHYGGGLKADKKPTANWCTQTSTTAATDALKQMGSKLQLNDLNRQKLPDGRTAIAGSQAYDAPLQPGDLIMYLFDGCQYGGHTVTVIDDLGDSFTHISGNTGDAIMVGIGEAKRLKQPPKPKSGNAEFVLGECNKVATADERKASTEYIARWNFEGKVLVYSIIRYGRVLQQLEDASKST